MADRKQDMAPVQAVASPIRLTHADVLSLAYLDLESLLCVSVEYRARGSGRPRRSLTASIPNTAHRYRGCHVAWGGC